MLTAAFAMEDDRSGTSKLHDITADSGRRCIQREALVLGRQNGRPRAAAQLFDGDASALPQPGEDEEVRTASKADGVPVGRGGVAAALVRREQRVMLQPETQQRAVERE